MNAPVVQVALPEPPWLRQHVFKLKDVSSATGTKISTINYWCGIAEAFGYRLLQPDGHRRRLTGHAVYVIGILQALAEAGLTISRSLIKSVLTVTHATTGRPILPGMMDQLHLGDGPTVIEVDLSQIWLTTESNLEQKI